MYSDIVKMVSIVTRKIFSQIVPSLAREKYISLIYFYSYRKYSSEIIVYLFYHKLRHNNESYQISMSHIVLSWIYK